MRSTRSKQLSIENNTITNTAGERWAFWRLDQADATPGWDFCSPTTRDERDRRFTQMLANLSGYELQLFDTRQPSPVTEWHQELAEGASPAMRDALHAATQRSLAACPVVPVCYLGVQIPARDDTAYRRRYEAVAGCVAGLGNDAPATESELAWLCAHHQLRGIAALQTAQGLSTDAPIKQVGGQLHLEHPLGDSYTQWLALAAMPPDLTGHQWGRLHHPVANFNGHVDVCCRIRLTPADEAASLARRSTITAFESVLQFRTIGRHADTDSTDSAELLPQVEAELTRTGAPMVEATVLYAVHAATSEECAYDAQRLQARFANNGFKLVGVPRRELFAVHASTEPASPRGHRAWPQLMPCRSFAAAAFAVNSSMGDSTGPAVGVATRAPFRFDPLAGAQESDSTVSLFLGLMGSGKTQSSVLATIWAYLSGAAVIDVDPQGDTAHIGDIIGHENVTEISFGRDAEPGSADPYLICTETDAAAVAADICRELLAPNLWDTHEADVIAACMAERDRLDGQPTLNGVIERLIDNASPCGPALDSMSKFDVATALFADPHNPPTGLPGGHRWTRVVLAGVQLGADGDTISGRLARAVMTAVSAVITDHAFSSRRKQVIRWDELHLFLHTARARRDLARFGLTGRKFNVAVIGCTQLWSHLTDDIQQIVGNVFAFRAATDPLAADMCVALGIDTGYATVLKSLPPKSGQALWRDRTGRVGHIRFEQVSPAWAAALDTTPPPAAETAA